MSRLSLFSIALIFCVSICMAEDAVTPATKRLADAQKNYDSAVRRASEAFYKSLVAADKQAIEDLKVAIHLAKPEEAKTLNDALAAAQANLTANQQAISNHVVIQVEQNQWSQPPSGDDRKMPESEAEALSPDVNMSEHDCDAMEQKKKWAKVLTEKSTDGNCVEYQSGFVWSSGFQPKDVVLFKDGKVAKVKIIRAIADDPAFTIPVHKQSDQVSGYNYFGH